MKFAVLVYDKSLFLESFLCFENIEQEKNEEDMRKKRRYALSKVSWLRLSSFWFEKKKILEVKSEKINHFWSSSTSWTSLFAFSLSPGISVVHKVRLSRNNCIINVESEGKKNSNACNWFLFSFEDHRLPLYVSSFNVSNSAMASSNAWRKENHWIENESFVEKKTNLFCQTTSTVRRIENFIVKHGEIQR